MRGIAGGVAGDVQLVEAGAAGVGRDLGHQRVTSSQVVVERGSQPVSVDDPAGLPERDGDELEHRAVAVGPDGKGPLLAVVLVLDEPGGIPPGVFDVRVLNAVFASRWQDFPLSSVS